MDWRFIKKNLKSQGMGYEAGCYAWMSWICVLNPSEDTFEGLKPYIQEAYGYAKEKFARRK